MPCVFASNQPLKRGVTSSALGQPSGITPTGRSFQSDGPLTEEKARFAKRLALPQAERGLDALAREGFHTLRLQKALTAVKAEIVLFDDFVEAGIRYSSGDWSGPRLVGRTLSFISRISCSTLSWWFAYEPSSRDGPSGCSIAYQKLLRRLFILPTSVGVQPSTLLPYDLRLSASRSRWASIVTGGCTAHRILAGAAALPT